MSAGWKITPGSARERVAFGNITARGKFVRAFDHLVEVITDERNSGADVYQELAVTLQGLGYETVESEMVEQCGATRTWFNTIEERVTCRLPKNHLDPVHDDLRGRTWRDNYGEVK